MSKLEQRSVNFDELADLADMYDAMMKDPATQEMFEENLDAIEELVDGARATAQATADTAWTALMGTMNEGQKQLVQLYCMDATNEWIEETEDWTAGEYFDLLFDQHEAIEQALWVSCEVVYKQIITEVGAFIGSEMSGLIDFGPFDPEGKARNYNANDRLQQVVDKVALEQKIFLRYHGDLSQYWNDVKAQRMNEGLYRTTGAPRAPRQTVSSLYTNIHGMNTSQLRTLL